MQKQKAVKFEKGIPTYPMFKVVRHLFEQIDVLRKTLCFHHDKKTVFQLKYRYKINFYTLQQSYKYKVI